MANRLQRGVEHIQQRLGEDYSVSVTYSNGTHSATFNATPTSGVDLTIVDKSGATRIVRAERDYLFDAADLVLNGVLTEPARGHTITEGSRTYELLSPGGDEPVWRYSDAGKTRIRAHTKEVVNS